LCITITYDGAYSGDVDDGAHSGDVDDGAYVMVMRMMMHAVGCGR
jgi:hypothetical protein